LSQRLHLHEMINSSPRDVRMVEVQALLDSSQLSRGHGALQYSLTAATYLMGLTASCDVLGLNITAAAQNESANVLWDQGEMTASIRVLQDMNSSLDLRHQAVRVGKAELLAKLVRFTVSPRRLTSSC
jgi:ataxia telangiectasia mutated family protein